MLAFSVVKYKITECRNYKGRILKLMTWILVEAQKRELVFTLTKGPKAGIFH